MSHAAVDAEVVEAIRDRLELITGGQLRFYLSSDSIPAGERWAQSIEKHLAQATCTIVFLSHAAAASQWVLFETGFAWARGQRVIPLGMLGYDITHAAHPISARQGINVSSATDLNRLVEKLNHLFHKKFKGRFSRADYTRIVSRARLHGTTIHALRLSDRAHVYAEGAEVVARADKDAHVKATVTVFDPDDTTDSHFRRYLDTISQKCGEAAEIGGRFTYEVVFGFQRTQQGNIPPAVRHALLHRYAVFSAAGAEDRVTYFELPGRLALNMLFVNEDIAVIGFPEDASKTKLQYGVKLSGADVVAPIVHWFDTCVRNQAWQLQMPSLHRRRHHRTPS